MYDLFLLFYIFIKFINLCYIGSIKKVYIRDCNFIMIHLGKGWESHYFHNCEGSGSSPLKFFLIIDNNKSGLDILWNCLIVNIWISVSCKFLKKLSSLHEFIELWCKEIANPCFKCPQVSVILNQFYLGSLEFKF